MPDENYYEVLVEYFEFEGDAYPTSTVVETCWGSRTYMDDYIFDHMEDFEREYGDRLYDIKIIEYQPHVVYSTIPEEDEYD